MAGWLCALGVLAAAGGPSAAAENCWVEAYNNTSYVQLGETFRYVLTAGARDGLVKLPGPGAPFPGCQVLRYSETDVSLRHEGFMARQGTYTLAAFAVDRIETPPLQVHFAWPDGTTATARAPLRTLSVGSEFPQGLRLKPPRPPWPAAWDWLLTCLLVAGLGVAAWGFGRRLRDFRPAAGSAPPHSEAFRQLEWLRKSTAFAQLLADDYFVGLSKILRRYVTDRFQFPALELPRQEILDRLKAGGTPPGLCRLLDVLLFRADLIKFAKVQVTFSHMIKAHKRARRFIAGTAACPQKGKR